MFYHLDISNDENNLNYVFHVCKDHAIQNALFLKGNFLTVPYCDFFSVHKVEVNVSIEQSLSLHLYTVDPVEVYFQKDNSNYPVRLCGPDHQCLQNWEYNNNTQTIELDAVKREHLGIYTVKDIQKKCVFCKYILISLPNFVSTESRVVYIRIGFCLLFFVIVCAIICKKLKYCKSRVKYMSCPVGNSGRTACM